MLEINFQERKKNSEWGKPKAQSLSTADIEALPDPIDRHLLSLLGGAERGDIYGYSSGYSNSSYGVLRYRLAGTLLDTVLPLLAASGRVRMRRASHPPVLLEDVTPDLDPPWHLAVGVTQDGAKKNWVLAGGLTRGDQTMSLAQPALVVPGLVFWDGRFARLDDAGAFPWVPILRRVGAIAVPVGRSDDLLGQLLQMPSLPRLDLPEELRYTEEAVQPRPRLVVKAPKQQYRDPTLFAAELLLRRDEVAHPARGPDPVTGEARHDSRPCVALGLDKVISHRIELRLGRVGIELHPYLEARRDAPGEGRAPPGALLHGVHVALGKLKLSLDTTRTERRSLPGSARSRRQRRAQLVFHRLATFFLLLCPPCARE